MEMLTKDVLAIPHRGLGDNGIKALAATLKYSDVIELNLCDNRLNKGDGSKIVMEIMLDVESLQILDLSENGFTSKEASHLTRGMCGTRSITHLNLAGNNFGYAGAALLAKGIEDNKSIQDLNLSQNDFSANGIRYIALALCQNSTLRKLDLSWNKIRGKGAVMIGKALQVNTALRDINLSWNGFGYEGTLAMKEMLKINDTLEELDLSNNRINWKAALFVRDGLCANNNLRVLRLGMNPLTTTGALDVLDGVSDPRSGLEVLDLTDIPVVPEFELVAEGLRSLRPFEYTHGGVVKRHDFLGQRRDRVLPPIARLVEYINEKKIRPLELFRSSDKSCRLKVDRNDFVQNLRKNGIDITQRELLDAMYGRKFKEGGKGKPKIVTYSDLRLTVKAHIDNEQMLRRREMVREQKMAEYHRRILTPEPLPKKEPLPSISSGGPSDSKRPGPRAPDDDLPL